jgi:GTP-binding protein
MLIKSAKFVTSSAKYSQCPTVKEPEFAFIGRSNVGKSSLINMLTGLPRLAKVSSTPGKTRTINHFLINDVWYIADLPGYGYAKVSSKLRNNWSKEVESYIIKRENLACLFVLIDSRIAPQESDLRFMEMLGLRQVPIARIFTKADKIKPGEVRKAVEEFDKLMLDTWEELPVTFISSSVKKTGKEQLLNFIEQSINIFRKSG